MWLLLHECLTTQGTNCPRKTASEESKKDLQTTYKQIMESNLICDAFAKYGWRKDTDLYLPAVLVSES